MRLWQNYYSCIRILGLFKRGMEWLLVFFFFFSSRRRHTRCREVSWARRCVQETVLKSPGLSEVSFDFMIPQVKYPFANVDLKDADYYLEALEKLKTRKKPFRFIVVRLTQGNTNLFDTNIKVSLEEYSIKEDAKEGIDLIVSVKLKQYKDYATKVVSIPVTNTMASTSNKVIFIPATESRPPGNQPSNKTYTVKKGDCLWNICKQYLGNGSKYNEIAKLNNISNPNLIYPGQVIKLGQYNSTTSTGKYQKRL
eukprot:TRINITY_DN8170_c0_g1_i9.p1 TRINITY_DN8170_c0_g1~~TRINITY_DN8170_c0_g1_i9.p1  ORF type:complete len:253 (-),score=35.34 TRINITY_DN8170_c0_g1_i9:343-1101(-)